MRNRRRNPRRRISGPAVKRGSPDTTASSLITNSVATVSRSRRAHAANAPGDFYVEDQCCTLCGVPQAIAPELFSSVNDPLDHCYVKRQPSNWDETQQIIDTIRAAELGCIRYAGKDRSVQAELVEAGEWDICDHLLPEFKPTRGSSWATYGSNNLARRKISSPGEKDFGAASADFKKFLSEQLYPVNLLWAEPDDVLLSCRNDMRKYIVRKGDVALREQRAKDIYREAMSLGVGVAFEAQCKTSEWSVCRLFVPNDSDEAQRLMIPATGLKYSAAINPPETALVERNWWWTILRLIRWGEQPIWD